MRRLYFLVPDLQITQRIVEALQEAGVEERHVHVVAAPGVELEDLPDATRKETSYQLSAAKMGAEYGGTMGLLFGLLALNLPGAVLAGGALLAMGALGAGMGACLGCLLGEDAQNVHIKSLQSAIEEGKLLVLVDVPDERLSEIETLINARYPEAELKATETTLPHFPY